MMLPEKYTIKITVEPEDDTGAELSATLGNVRREDIFRPDYNNAGIVAVVKALEYYVYGVGEDPDKACEVKPQ